MKTIPRTAVAHAGRFVVAGAVLAGIASIALGVAELRRPPGDAALSALVAAASSHRRSIEPRLGGGFAWAPFQPAASGESGRRLGSLDRTAAATVLAASKESTPAARHVIGVARLVTGSARAALPDLRSAAEAGNEPLYWSDFAAALYTTAVQHDQPQLLAEALAACDQALALDAGSAEALFNRALILSRFGLRDDAREAWERYLLADGASEWAVEARRHLELVQPVPPFVAVLDREYARLAGDPAAVIELARRDPESARGYGWKEILGRWGEAAAKQDDREAARHLRIARALGAGVVRANGDGMLERVVAAIDAAAPASRAALAAAHVDYRAGIDSFQDNRPSDAERLLKRAAVAFERERSPMALIARYFAANTIHEQGRRAEALQRLELLLANAPREFPAYRAQLHWQFGVCHAAAGSWGQAIAALEQSASEFDALGEHQNAGAVRRGLAFAYDRTGDADRAWATRMASLRGVGIRSSLPLEKAVASIAQAAMLRGEWKIAESFLSLHAGIARRLGDDVQLTDALLKRATARVHLRNAGGAQNDLDDATSAVARIDDPAYRAWGEASCLRVRAMTTPSAAEAAELLTRALEFQTARGERLYLPGLLLERGRARRRAGDAAGAAADFRAGIEQLEKQRESLPAGDARWGAFHAAEELFEEAIDLAVSRSDPEEALAMSEAARARALLESYGRSPALDLRNLPANTTIVEYAVLPARLVIFTIDRSGIRATATSTRRDLVTTAAGQLAGALASDDRDAWKARARTLYRLLIEPVEPQLLGSGTVVFVPDAFTAGIPFAALLDAQGTSLLQRHVLLTAPSAAVHLAAGERRRAARRPRSILVVADTGSGRQDKLGFVGLEPERVATPYDRAVVRRDEDADLASFATQAAAADVIHFAGHAIGDETGFEPASIVLRQNGRERRVRVAEIAALRLRSVSTIVLAGCNTARGERRAAEGVISVAHGFLSAGVPSVVATLWPIDDAASATLFPRLHEHLAAGLSPAEALRAVQLEAMQRGDVRASMWAALEAIGS